MSRCLSRLVELDEEGYSATALRRLADRRKFPSRLDFTRQDVVDIQTETIDRMSISGVQEKISLRLERGELVPVGTGGHYILKPTPGQPLPRFQGEVPANEHLTMQLAEQVYDIETAANACIRLADGELAYITRRFDRTPEGQRIAQEDFCQLMDKTPQTAGPQFKYASSYEQLARTLQDFCSAYIVEAEKLFRRIIFNYLVANGDAHLKNFSIRPTESFGDYVLTPAYDLMSTTLHIPEESRLALDLFAGDENPKGVTTHGFVTGGDFEGFGRRIGLTDAQIEETLEDLGGPLDEAGRLVERSFLGDEATAEYLEILEDRRRALRLG